MCITCGVNASNASLQLICGCLDAKYTHMHFQAMQLVSAHIDVPRGHDLMLNLGMT